MSDYGMYSNIPLYKSLYAVLPTRPTMASIAYLSEVSPQTPDRQAYILLLLFHVYLYIIGRSELLHECLCELIL